MAHFRYVTRARPRTAPRIIFSVSYENSSTYLLRGLAKRLEHGDEKPRYCEVLPLVLSDGGKLWSELAERADGLE